MSIIEVTDLKKTFQYYEKEIGLKNSFKNLFHRTELVRDAVKGVSFQIEEGEMVGFLGPNGAGKTTTLKMLSGILYPSSGQALISGYVPWERKHEFKMQFSIVMGQKNQLWWDLPANESIYLNKCIYEVEDKVYERIMNELTELLDVKHLLKVQVRRLSLGERMKMELIASLIHQPKILFLDEPTIGLDIIAQKKIRDFLSDYNKNYKTTVMLTSHYMHDIENLCKRVIVINNGKIVYDGNLDTINHLCFENKLLKLSLEAPVTKNDLEKFGIIKEYKDLEVVLQVKKKDLKSCCQTVISTLPIKDFNIEDISIEEGVAMLYEMRDENYG